MTETKKSMNFILTFFLLANVTGTFAQDLNRVIQDDYRRNMDRKVYHIPDLPGYVTLKGDFHIHTIFSDGLVWPEFRVLEAWKEGLDVIAITDHIEYRPHKEYTIGDHNISFEIARSKAEEMNIILIKGTEITRSMPPGHFNALFLSDVNPLDRKDPMAQIEEAARQGAFILWNHPGWASQQPDTTKWWDFHTTILEKGWLHGVEVVNSGEWYPVVMDWCREKNLAAFANSDIHEAVDYNYDLSLPNSHRPMTLVIAKDRSEDGVREALFSGRTVGFTGEQLMGPEELILDLFHAAVKIYAPFLSNETQGRMVLHRELKNPSDLTFILEKVGEGPQNRSIVLRPHSMVILSYPAEGEELRYRLINCWTGSREHPVVQFD